MCPSPQPDDTDGFDPDELLRQAGRMISNVDAPPRTKPTPEAIEAAIAGSKLTARFAAIAREVLIEGLDFDLAMLRHEISRPDLKRILDSVEPAARLPPGWERVELYLPAGIAADVEQLVRQAIGLPPKGRLAPRQWRKPERTRTYDATALAGRLTTAMWNKQLTYTSTAAAIGISRAQVQRTVEAKPIGDDAVERVFAWLGET
ncbi:hypothetical protein JMJ56_29790 [Belnapia sp. T18]|uniref:Uncharacterized protein n=1 Tax=Belnapia arida TaxID=2804533 RepID=A0ABS1UBV6_9PROT|nr:hypothetical protein [Belnapia arida]MBL6082172.1 hypothetical protein [Belnapia arida]